MWFYSNCILGKSSKIEIQYKCNLQVINYPTAHHKPLLLIECLSTQYMYIYFADTSTFICKYECIITMGVYLDCCHTSFQSGSGSKWNYRNSFFVAKPANKDVLVSLVLLMVRTMKCMLSWTFVPRSYSNAAWWTAVPVVQPCKGRLKCTCRPHTPSLVQHT